METCATHGLRYDPAQHDGCVLCRRLAQPGSPAQSAPAPKRTALLAVLAGVGVLGFVVAAWQTLGDTGQPIAEPMAAPPQPTWLEAPAPAPAVEPQPPPEPPAAAPAQDAPIDWLAVVHEKRLEEGEPTVERLPPPPSMEKLDDDCDRLGEWNERPQDTIQVLTTVSTDEDAVTVAVPAGSPPKRIPRAIFKRARQECGYVMTMPEGARCWPLDKCLLGLRPARKILTQIPVNLDLGRNDIRAYDVNANGFGYDCLWYRIPSYSRVDFITRDRSGSTDNYPKVAVIVAAPKGRMPSVELHVAGRHEVQIEDPPWPADYEVAVTYKSFASKPHKDTASDLLRPRLSAICMRFRDPEPARVYIGVSAWIDGPAARAKHEDLSARHAEVLSAFGLKGTFGKLLR